MYHWELSQLQGYTVTRAQLDTANIASKHDGGDPVHKHIESVPPAYHASQVGRSPDEEADKSRKWDPFRLLEVQEINQSSSSFMQAVLLDR